MNVPLTVVEHDCFQEMFFFHILVHFFWPLGTMTKLIQATSNNHT